jgi:hypothetical protein
MVLKLLWRKAASNYDQTREREGGPAGCLTFLHKLLFARLLWREAQEGVRRVIFTQRETVLPPDFNQIQNMQAFTAVFATIFNGSIYSSIRYAKAAKLTRRRKSHSSTAHARNRM